MPLLNHTALSYPLSLGLVLEAPPPSQKAGSSVEIMLIFLELLPLKGRRDDSRDLR